MDLKKKKILVTGGTGFIGSHTVVQLLEGGCDVIIADNLSNSREEVVDSIELITGARPIFIKLDICDKEGLKKLFQTNKIDGVIHFAAKKLVGESVEQPLYYYKSNLLSLMNVVECCLEFEVYNFVFSSSCTVYGQPDVLPASETSPRKEAESPYGNTKIISEDILSDVSKVSPLKVVSLRYFNPVGAHDSALIGEYPLNKPSNLMPVITQFAIGKLNNLKVFGNDYDTQDGSCVRDYIHVLDVADAHLEAFRFLSERKDQENFTTFNLGTGTGTSVFHMINTFEKVNNVELKYEITERRPGDVEKVYASTKKANEVLGWKAKKSLDDMVSSAWKWEQHLSEKEKV